MIDLNKIPKWREAFGDRLKDEIYHDRLLRDVDELTYALLYRKYGIHFNCVTGMLELLDILEQAQETVDFT